MHLLYLLAYISHTCCLEKISGFPIQCSSEFDAVWVELQYETECFVGPCCVVYRVHSGRMGFFDLLFNIMVPNR